MSRIAGFQLESAKVSSGTQLQGSRSALPRNLQRTGGICLSKSTSWVGSPHAGFFPVTLDCRHEGIVGQITELIPQ
jgi:hypothetical protein